MKSFFYLTSIDVEESSCMDNLPEYLCSSLVAFINCDIDLNNDEELTFNWCSTVLSSLLVIKNLALFDSDDCEKLKDFLTEDIFDQLLKKNDENSNSRRIKKEVKEIRSAIFGSR